MYINKQSSEDIFRRYLNVTPLALAVFRSIEAKNISQVKMKKPVLDLGCGFGEFAGVFFDSQVEMGLDVSWKELITANKTKKFKKLTWADARDMPFQDNYFGTVLSVSVMEHIRGVNEVVAEVYRVLQPGGKFIFTVNTSKINDMLFWPKFFDRFNLSHLGLKYKVLYNKVFHHETLWSKNKWLRETEKNGFKIEKAHEIISPAATQLFDLFILTAWPSQLIKLIIGKRWAWRPQWFREWLIRKYAWVVDANETEGSNLFVVAEKPPK